MQRQVWAGAALVMALGLGACSGFDSATSATQDAIGSGGGRLGMPWGGPRSTVPMSESLTMQRVRGGVGDAGVMAPEAGNVWPEQEAPRATLANPDEALRGIPSYQPGEAPPAMPRQRRSSTTPPDLLATPQSPPQLRSPAPPQPIVPPPAARADGRVIQTPQGAVVTSGGTDRIQSYNRPGGGSGVIHQDGNVATITGPDGRTQQVIVPR